MEINNRGLDAYNHHEYDNAIAYLDQALAIDTKLAVAYSNRGMAWCGKHEYDKAIADLDRALAIDPSSIR